MKSQSSKLRIVAMLAAVAAPVALSLAQQPVAPTATPPAPVKSPEALKPGGTAVVPAPAPIQPAIPAPNSLPDALRIDNLKFDWGDISDTEAVEHVFNFTNIADKEVTIAVAASCGCTVPTLEKTTYKPGENGKVTARFDPHNRQGPQTKTLTFTVVNPQGVFAQQIATLSANVKALVVFDPPKMFLSEVDHTTGQTTKLTITGRKEGFKVESVTSNSEHIKVQVGEATTGTENGEAFTKVPIELVVGKGAPIGTLQAQIEIKTNDERVKLQPYFMGADVVGDVKATPAQAILRVNEPSTNFTTEVRFDSRSGTPFNILSMETDARKDMRVVTDFKKSDDGSFYTITLSGITPAEGGMVQSFLTVSTDAKGGETLKIPFTAVIRKLAPTGGVNPLPGGTAVPMPTKMPLGPKATPLTPETAKPQ